MSRTLTTRIDRLILLLFIIGIQSLQSQNNNARKAMVSPPCEPVTYDQGHGIRGRIASPGEQDCFTFTGEAGQRINVFSLKFIAARQTLRLLKPDSSILAFCNPAFGDCEIDNVILPVSGAYILTISYADNATGDYIIFLNWLNGNIKPITFGHVIDSDIHPIGDQDSFTFDGQAGQRVTFFLNPQFPFGISLQLFNPNGETLAVCDYSFDYCQLDNLILPATGTYTLTVNGRSDFMGGYSLALNRLDVDNDTITYNQSTLREILPMGDQDGFIYNGQKGHRVTVFLDNQTPGSLSLHLRKPDSSALAFCDFSKDDCQIDNATLPDSGVYTITVDGQAGVTGNYNLALNRLDDDNEAITYDQSILREISPLGDQDGFTFNGEKGRHITVFLNNQTSGNLSLRLNRPNGSALALCEFTKGDCQIDNVILPVTGIYAITVDGQGSSAGKYNLALNRLDRNVESITYGQSILREISPAGDQDEFTFVGARGHQVTAVLDNRASGPSRFSLRLTKPDGNMLAYCDFSSIGCQINAVTLPDSGIYTLTVDGYYGTIGEYVLRLSGTTAVQEQVDDMPKRFELKQNYPNPFFSGVKSHTAGNPTTTIHFEMPKPSHVTIKIFDVQGRVVRRLVDRPFAAGRFTEIWDGRKDDGALLGNGAYFLQMQTADFVSTKKVLLVR